MNQKRGIAFILASIFLVFYDAVYGTGLATVEFLGYFVAPIFCIIGFILSMLKEK